jgi:ribosomal protein S18 acetylase RimI-like enzyme
MVDFTLKQATGDDYKFCYDLTRRNMLVLFTKHWGGWNPKKFREDFSAKKTKIVTINGRRYGFVSIRKDTDKLYLENIQLSKSMRGKGLGTQIMNDMIEKNKGNVIELMTFTDNPAFSLYKRCGFKVKKNTKGTVLMELKP